MLLPTRAVSIAWLFLFCANVTIAFGDQPLDLKQVTKLDGSEGLSLAGTSLQFTVPQENDSVLIPRLYASLASAQWKEEENSEVIVDPRPVHWIIKWKARPETAKSIQLNFDSAPTLADGNHPVEQQGDGRVILQAYQAEVQGDKLLFEPQPHKNTVGYWIDPEAFATWTFDVTKPGSFNVGILQGCGKDQGGSDVKLTISSDKQDKPISTLDFLVEETGHFQNFKWRTVGVVSIAKPGQYKLTLKPNKIANKAVMDVREIQLVPLPK